MSIFIVLCLLSRLAYAVNDILVGRLARQHSRVEIAALRGISLGITMAPLLWWVPAEAWPAFAARWQIYILLTAVTAAANVLQNHAARFLPFGLRASLILTALSIVSVVFGATLFSERLSLAQIAWCVLLIGSAAFAALGGHAAHEIEPNISKGSALALGAGACLAMAAVFTKRLADETDPLLTAWAWEFGAGLILVVPLFWEWRGGVTPGLGRRFLRTAAASVPTVVGSGASMVALGLGALGLWGALAGTQVLFAAVLGVWLHREAMGARRWICFVVAAVALAGLALASR